MQQVFQIFHKIIIDPKALMNYSFMFRNWEDSFLYLGELWRNIYNGILSLSDSKNFKAQKRECGVKLFRELRHTALSCFLGG
jgi:hypothetical protein